VLCGLIILNIYELDIAVFINAILKNKICAYEFRFELNFWCRFWVVWNGYFETLTPIPTMLLQTMPSLTFDVSEDILAGIDRSARILMIPDQDDPYEIVCRSAIASSSSHTSVSPTPTSSQMPTPVAEHSSSSRQLTLHQALARVSPRFTHWYVGIAPGFTSQGILRSLQPPLGSVPDRCSIV
jgi:hypothetical protein